MAVGQVVCAPAPPPSPQQYPHEGLLRQLSARDLPQSLLGVPPGAELKHLAADELPRTPAHTPPPPPPPPISEYFLSSMAGAAAIHPPAERVGLEVLLPNLRGVNPGEQIRVISACRHTLTPFRNEGDPQEDLRTSIADEVLVGEQVHRRHAEAGQVRLQLRLRPAEEPLGLLAGQPDRPQTGEGLLQLAHTPQSAHEHLLGAQAGYHADSRPEQMLLTKRHTYIHIILHSNIFP